MAHRFLFRGSPTMRSLAAAGVPLALGSAALLSLALASGPGRAAPPAPPNGQALFKAQCAVCHSTTNPGKKLMGPTLAGVSGRKAAMVPGFAYSPAMKGAKLKWDKATLDRYLADPRRTVPGTKMVYGGVKDPAKRAAIVQYVLTLK